MLRAGSTFPGAAIHTANDEQLQAAFGRLRSNSPEAAPRIVVVALRHYLITAGDGPVQQDDGRITVRQIDDAPTNPRRLKQHQRPNARMFGDPRDHAAPPCAGRIVTTPYNVEICT